MTNPAEGGLWPAEHRPPSYRRALSDAEAVGVLTQALERICYGAHGVSGRAELRELAASHRRIAVEALAKVRGDRP